MVHVLGYSGLDAACEHQRARYPGHDDRRIRFFQGLDSAAALTVDGEVVAAAAEERFTGDKTTGRFPVHAIRYCLDSADLTPSDLDAVAHGFHYQLDPDVAEAGPCHAETFRALYRPERQGELWRAYLGPGPPVPVTPVSHHLAHAYSAFGLSGFADSAVLVSDGMGESESITAFHGTTLGLQALSTTPINHSLGIFYAVATYYLGFVPLMDEYKVMGMASYGDPSRYREAFADLVLCRPRGRVAVPLIATELNPVDRDLHTGALERLVARFGPPRQPDHEVRPEHFDLAAAVQEAFERAILHVSGHLREVTGSPRLCLAGGTALNCTANGRLADARIFDDIFIQPAAGDDGTAVGAALAVSADLGRPSKVERMTMPYWGPGYDDEQLRRMAEERAGQTVKCFEDDVALADEVARDLANGMLVGWFQGRMEFGPRALGNRSILADPRTRESRDRLNRLVKRREDFRPFAPAVTAEAAARYFDITPGTEHWYSHMITLTRVREGYVNRLQAVTHVDGTARAQTVQRRENPRFHALLRALDTHAGVPVVLNTSFNVQGQPIVRTPREALDTAVRAGLDRLVLGRSYLRLHPPAPGQEAGGYR